MAKYYGDQFTFKENVEVPVSPLDSLTYNLSEISLLKIDVQGYEREVLKGATRTLSKTRLVLIEANLVSHYENDILFPELNGLMSDAGFVLTNLSPLFFKEGKALWADAVYLNNATPGY